MRCLLNLKGTDWSLFSLMEDEKRTVRAECLHRSLFFPRNLLERCHSISWIFLKKISIIQIIDFNLSFIIVDGDLTGGIEMERGDCREDQRQRWKCRGIVFSNWHARCFTDPLRATTRTSSESIFLSFSFLVWPSLALTQPAAFMTRAISCFLPLRTSSVFLLLSGFRMWPNMWTWSVPGATKNEGFL